MDLTTTTGNLKDGFASVTRLWQLIKAASVLATDGAARAKSRMAAVCSIEERDFLLCAESSLHAGRDLDEEEAARLDRLFARLADSPFLTVDPQIKKRLQAAARLLN
jgi:hypothetical protein